jgi:hypothetical protein
VVLSPPNPRSVQVGDSAAVVSSLPPRPRLRSIPVEEASQQLPSRLCSDRPAAVSVKVSGLVPAGAKKEAFSSRVNGWQEVHRKKWRKKLSASPARGRRPVHERLRRSAGMGPLAGQDPVPHRERNLLDLFKKRDAGRCFRCLASDHRVDLRNASSASALAIELSIAALRPAPPHPLSFRLIRQPLLASPSRPAPLLAVRPLPWSRIRLSGRPVPSRAPPPAGLTGLRRASLALQPWWRQRMFIILAASSPSPCATTPGTAFPWR